MRKFDFAYIDFDELFNTMKVINKTRRGGIYEVSYNNFKNSITTRTVYADDEKEAIKKLLMYSSVNNFVCYYFVHEINETENILDVWFKTSTDKIYVYILKRVILLARGDKLLQRDVKEITYKNLPSIRFATVKSYLEEINAKE